MISNFLLKEDDPDKLTFTDADHFSHSLEQLSYGSIHVLLAAGEIAKKKYGEDWLAAIDGDFNHARQMKFDDLSEALPEYHPSLLMGLISELDGMNLLHKGMTYGGGVQNNYSNYPLSRS